MVQRERQELQDERRRRRRRSLRIAAGCLVGLTLVAASCDDESALPILTVRLTDDATVTTTIRCADAVRTLVSETNDVVRIRLKGTEKADIGEICTVPVTLHRPLGGRLLVDGRDERAWRFVEGELKIVRLAGCRSASCEVDWSLDDHAKACDAATFLLASVGTIVGARGDSVVSVVRCSLNAAIVSINGAPFVWERVGSTWFMRSTLDDACSFRTDAAPVSDEDCALVGGSS